MRAIELAAAAMEGVGRAAVEIAVAVLASAWVIFVLVQVLAVMPGRRRVSGARLQPRARQDVARAGGAGDPAGKGTVFGRESA